MGWTLRVVAFLRGMNLGNRRITNADLKAEFERLGFESVITFQASGNVVFEDPSLERPDLIARIESGLEEGLGYTVPTVLRSEEELGEIVDRQPFPPDVVAAGKGKVQVSLLARKPSAAARKAVLGLASDGDLLSFGPAELYWLPSGGTLESGLDQKAIHEALGMATMRTMGTIERLHAKLASQ